MSAQTSPKRKTWSEETPVVRGHTSGTVDGIAYTNASPKRKKSLSGKSLTERESIFNDAFAHMPFDPATQKRAFWPPKYMHIHAPEARIVFKAHDFNANGTLDKAEMEEVLKYLNVDCVPTMIEKIFDHEEPGYQLDSRTFGECPPLINTHGVLSH
jgi:hypothetical protein